MISRILHLLVIDVLAVGLAIRRAGGADATSWTRLLEEGAETVDPDSARHRISHLG